MDEDQRTVWCGNLSDKVTEDLLYELFLQGGPVQKVSIPKDRDGKQRTYGFITFKHAISVPYALDLFDGTSLFDRVLSMKTRNNIEPQPQPYYNNGSRNDRQEPSQDINNMINLRDQMLLGNLMAGVSMCGLYAGQNMIMYPNQLNPWANNQEDRRSHNQRGKPYQRERERDRERERSDYKDRNDHRDRERHSSSHRSNDNYSRHSDHRNSRRNNYRKN